MFIGEPRLAKKAYLDNIIYFYFVSIVLFFIHSYTTQILAGNTDLYDKMPWEKHVLAPVMEGGLIILVSIFYLFKLIYCCFVSNVN